MLFFSHVCLCFFFFILFTWIFYSPQSFLSAEQSREEKEPGLSPVFTNKLSLKGTSMRVRLCVCVLRHYPTVAEFRHTQHTHGVTQRHTSVGKTTTTPKKKKERSKHALLMSPSKNKKQKKKKKRKEKINAHDSSSRRGT